MDSSERPLERPFERVLVVGLGNPGEEFAQTRHNVGAMVVERLVSATGIELREFSGGSRWGRGTVQGSELVLAIPLSFVNLSGPAVKSLLALVGLSPHDVVVVHDDLDLRLGEIRIRPVGGSGGHRGVQSLIGALGTDSFGRVRLGIGRPPGRQDPAKYVLRPFAGRQWPQIGEAVSHAVEAVLFLIANGFEKAMSEYNR